MDSVLIVAGSENSRNALSDLSKLCGLSEQTCTGCGNDARRLLLENDYDLVLINTPLPDEKWLRLYRSLGGEIVTLGTDAHTPGFVGCAVREGQALLRACGFRRFAAFRQGKPVWHEL